LVCLLAICCSGAFYYVYQANTQLTPILPPLAAQNHLQRWLQSDFGDLERREPLYHPDTVAKIYHRTGYKLLWLKNYELAESGKLLMQHLQETSADQRLDYHYHLTYAAPPLQPAVAAQGCHRTGHSVDRRLCLLRR
jgi:hypothetical protein